MNRRDHHPGPAGFTLMELLVVISLIALLTAMLLPAIKQVRTASVTTKCMANLRQLGMGVASYAKDYDDYLPPGYANPSGTWQSLTVAYMGAFDAAKVALCPAAAVPKGTLHYSGQFALFANLTGKPPPNRVKVGRMDELRPTGVLIFDGSQNPSSGNADPLSTEQNGMWEFYGENRADDLLPSTVYTTNLSDVANQRTARFRHGANNRACFVYGDLHAQIRGTSDMAKGDYRTRRNGRKWDYETWIP